MEYKTPIEIIESDMLKINVALDTLVSALTPYMMSLTAEQRKSLPKMGEKTLAFVEKAIEYCELKPDFVPRYLNTGDFKKNFETAKSLQSLLMIIKPLVSNIEDTMMICGSEAYLSSLTYYSSVKEAARRNVTDAKVIEEDLKHRFPGTPGTKKSDIIE